MLELIDKTDTGLKSMLELYLLFIPPRLQNVQEIHETYSSILDEITENFINLRIRQSETKFLIRI